MTFVQAAAFQWVNPKAWALALGATATFATKGRLVLDVALITLLFTLVGAPCVGAWTVFGVGMKRFLTRPWSMRAFNVGMALLLVASLYSLFTETR